MSKGLLVTAIIMISLSSSALAAPSEFKAIGDKASVTLEPEKSYLIIQTSSGSSMFSFPMTFIRRPEPADVADYRNRRGIALGKAHAKWVKRHTEWQTSAANWETLSKEAKGAIPRPQEPTEPTDANLAFPALEQENMVTIGPFNRFSKANGHSTFLHMVRPGRYAFYGPMDSVLGGGSCMCMGSFEFEVKPGQIVNAGLMKLNLMEQMSKAKAEGKEKPKSDFDLPEGMTSIGWDVPVAGTDIDPRLLAYKIVPAELKASGRFQNYFGIQIDRITPIPGVIDYDRDRIVDLKANLKSDK
ncbi:MAG: hypothetical protein ABI395_02380 [Sphingobium sp.]